MQESPTDVMKRFRGRKGGGLDEPVAPVVEYSKKVVVDDIATLKIEMIRNTTELCMLFKHTIEKSGLFVECWLYNRDSSTLGNDRIYVELQCCEDESPNSIALKPLASHYLPVLPASKLTNVELRNITIPFDFKLFYSPGGDVVESSDLLLQDIVLASLSVPPESEHCYRDSVYGELNGVKIYMKNEGVGYTHRDHGEETAMPLLVLTRIVLDTECMFTNKIPPVWPMLLSEKMAEFDASMNIQNIAVAIKSTHLKIGVSCRESHDIAAIGSTKPYSRIALASRRKAPVVPAVDISESFEDSESTSQGRCTIA
ncbi:MAG: hypothetical protein JSS82_07845 [Bacteroidetes bacterium]|nr:hypothetical protein [Bacteroidota bacterium]